MLLPAERVRCLHHFADIAAFARPWHTCRKSGVNGLQLPHGDASAVHVHVLKTLSHHGLHRTCEPPSLRMKGKTVSGEALASLRIGFLLEVSLLINQ